MDPSLGYRRLDVALLLAVGSFVVLIARRPEELFRAQFVYEEGNAFYAPTFFHGPELILEPWGGYLQIATRIGYEALSTVPVLFAPLVENVMSWTLLVAVAALIASDRLRPLTPNRSLRIGLAALLLILPAQSEVAGTFVNAQWIMGLGLIALSVAAPPSSRIGNAAELVAIGLAALNVSFSLLLAPLFWWFRGRSRQGVAITTLVVIGGLVQLVLALSSRSADAFHGVESLVATTILHLVVVPLVGQAGAERLVAQATPTTFTLIALVVCVTLATVAARSLPARAWAFVYGGLAVAAAGIMELGGAWTLISGQRYFVLWTFAVALTVAFGIARRQAPAYGLAGLLAIGIVADFRLPPHPDLDWDEHHACIRSADPCVVPAHPSHYAIEWPGMDGEYRIRR